MLAPLARNGTLDVWDDRRIEPGELWRAELKRALDSAKVAVLLVTPEFLASHFITENELPPLLESARGGGLRVLWIYIRAALYDETNIAQYQAVNDISRPLDQIRAPWRSLELTKIAKAIKEAFLSRKSEASSGAHTIPFCPQMRHRPQ
jgi:hypothetical protein